MAKKQKKRGVCINTNDQSEKNLKKSKKRCWQRWSNVIKWSSSPREGRRAHWKLNNKTKCIKEIYETPKILLKKRALKVIERTNYSRYRADREVRVIYKHERVWSWLRMNAGGVHNTFKSNEAPGRNPSGGRPDDLVADGWVTREQPACDRGITPGNRC